ncbi:MAG: hypothetical protein Q7T33_13540 [Dehalococcoidia bacterium]|nr:hypothetical protein [Dehalococcoidia bacterium]
MRTEEIEKCPICGGEGDPWEIEVFHRACRLKRAFPGAYHRDGDLLFFDPEKMRQQLENEESAEPRD